MVETKIGIISRKNIENKTVWSGTVYYLSRIIGENYKIVPIIIKEKIVKRVIRKLNWFIFRNRKSKFIQFSEKATVQKALKKAMKDGIGIFFAPAGAEWIASKGVPDKCKLIFLADATYNLMNGYYFQESTHDQIWGNEIDRRTLQRADAVIYASEWALNDAKNFYHVPEDKMFLIPFPAYMEDYYIEKRDLNTKKHFKILLVGLDWKRKGIDIAIECVRALNNHKTEWTFELNIIGVMNETNIQEKYIHFVGRLNKEIDEENKKLIEYYQESDLFLLPTLAECAGIVFSEASMYGLPIFTHDTGGISSYVKEHVNGICLPIGATGEDFAEEIEKIIAEKQIEVMSKSARQHYLQFLSSECWLKGFEKVIEYLDK